MAARTGGATTERFIVGAQKSTNQLKAVLATLLPAAGGACAGAGPSGSAVFALLSEITDSLSQALAALRCGATDTQGRPEQSSIAAGGGGRRTAPRRSGQRARADGACQMIVLQNGVQDSYTWRKYGQKEILGAKFPRSYFRCGRKPGCPVRKHVQQSDADPSKSEITYFNEHTCECDDPPPSSSSQYIVPDPIMITCSSGSVPSVQRRIPQPSSLPCLVPDLMAGSDIPGTAGVLQPVAAAAAVVPGRALSSTLQYDTVPDDTALLTPSMGEEEQAELLFIPSPACSLSELLLQQPTEVNKVETHGPPVWMEQDLGHDAEHFSIADFTVPEL